MEAILPRLCRPQANPEGRVPSLLLAPRLSPDPLNRTELVQRDGTTGTRKTSRGSWNGSWTKFMSFRRRRSVPYLAAQFCPGLFHNLQAHELSHRIREAENAVKILVEEEAELTAQGHGHGSRHANGSSSRATHDAEAQEAHGNDADEGSDDDDDGIIDHGDERSLEDIEEHFHLLEEEVANLVADVHDLALYTKLNVTGFMKILKVRRLRMKVLSATGTDAPNSQKHDVSPHHKKYPPQNH